MLGSIEVNWLKLLFKNIHNLLLKETNEFGGKVYNLRENFAL